MLNSRNHEFVAAPKAMSPKQKAQYLKWTHDGVAHVDILFKLQVKPADYLLTRKEDAGYCKEIARLKGLKKTQVQSAAYRYAMGRCRITKTTWQAQLDEEGLPEKDAQGKQVFMCIRKEITTIPPNAALIMFLLKNEEAQVEGSILSPDRVEEEIKKALENL